MQCNPVHKLIHSVHIVHEECLDEITVCHFRISAKPALYHSTKHSSDFKVRDGQRVPDIALLPDLFVLLQSSYM